VRSDPGASAYCGALPGMTPEKFRDAIESGNTYDGVMKKTPTTTGETYYVPSGRLHGWTAAIWRSRFSRTPIRVLAGTGPVSWRPVSFGGRRAAP
jgi:hypothetical protein